MYNNFEQPNLSSKDKEKDLLDPEKQEKILESFNQPYTDDEIDPVWSHLSRLRTSAYPPRQEVFNRDLGFGVNYKIYVTHFGETRCLIFQLLTENNQKPAEIILEQEIYENPGVWSMPHRIVRTGNLGISGSTFLAKIEEYVSILSNKGYDKLSEIDVDCSQSKVIEWLLKNGYQFEDDISTSEWDKLQSSPGQYLNVLVDNEDGIEGKDLFIFDNNPASQTLIQKYLISEKDGIPEIAMSYNELKKVPQLFRVALKKDFS